MPCTNKDHQDVAFFRKHGLARLTGISKYGIDVDSICKTTNIPDQINQVNSDRIVVHSDKADKNDAVKLFINEIKNMTSGRHYLFFNGAAKLYRSGVSLPEVERACYAIAGQDQKMQNKVTGIMRSLRSYH